MSTMSKDPDGTVHFASDHNAVSAHVTFHWAAPAPTGAAGAQGAADGGSGSPGAAVDGQADATAPGAFRKVSGYVAALTGVLVVVAVPVLVLWRRRGKGDPPRHRLSAR